MYLIMRGRFKVTQQNDSGRESLINILSRGNHFGELGLIQSAQRAADVTALIESEVMEIARDDFHEFMNSIPGFAANVSRTLSGWLRGTFQRKLTRHKIATLALGSARWRGRRAPPAR